MEVRGFKTTTPQIISSISPFLDHSQYVSEVKIYNPLISPSLDNRQELFNHDSTGGTLTVSIVSYKVFFLTSFVGKV